MEALRKVDNEVETGNIGVPNQGTRPTHQTPRRALKGRTQNVGTVFELSLALEIHYDDLAVELINYVRQIMADERELPVDPSELDMYGELRGRAVAPLVEHFKRRNVRTEVVNRPAFVQVLDPVNGGRFHGAS